jgi:lambda family phage portal protein
MPRHQVSEIASQLESARADFQAVKNTRFQRRRKGLSSSGSGADYHYRTEADWLKLIEYARDMDRNDPIVGQTIDRAVLNTVQGGFELDINTGDVGLDDDLLARWKEWTEDPEECDAAGERTFSELEYLNLRSAFTDGDVVPVGTDDGYLQIFEAHRCRTPRVGNEDIVHGVKLDGLRRRTAYYFTADDINPNALIKGNTQFHEPVPTRDGNGVRRVFHVYLSKRLSQTRGITPLAPIFDISGMHDDIQFAAALKQQISACFVVFRKKQPQGVYGGAGMQTGEQTVSQRRDGSTSLIENIAPALEYEGEPGEDLSGFSPQVPGDQFFPHVRLLLTMIGINLGMPLVMVLMDAKETNFSGWRGAVDQARMGFRHNQRRYATRFHTPCFLWKASQWAQKDPALLRAIRKIYGDTKRPKINHEWNFPQWPYIDPMKDRAADTLDIGNCQASSREVDARNGRKFFTKVERIIEERVFAIEKAKEAAKALNDKFPDDKVPVRWDQLFAFPSSDGVRVNFSGAVNDAVQPQEGNGNV